jgi:L-lactate dehydrogenase complex protein LldE
VTSGTPPVRQRVGSDRVVERAALMVTCLVDVFYPGIAEATVRLLRRRGVEVTVPDGQTCCGLPLFNAGYHREAARVARRTLGLFTDAAAVVVPSGSCAWMVRVEYPRLFPDEPDATRAAERVGERTWELSQLLAELDAGRPEAGRRGSPVLPAPLRVAYHDSCHLLRGLGESTAPRALLAAAPGVVLVDLPGADECCGFGGSFAVRLPDVSGAILRRKLEHVGACEADVVATCDPGCLMQIAGGLRRAAARTRALHLAELLEDRERETPDGPGHV